MPPTYRTLFAQLLRREFQARFRGALLGPLWPVLAPLAMMLVYTFVFERVLALRWPGHAEAGHAYALNLLAGLLAYNLLADVIARAPRLILENPSYVKKVIFPLDLLPWVATAGAGLQAGIGLVLLGALTAALAGPPHAAWVLVPLLALPILLWAVALAHLLAALGVFLRDIGQLAQPINMLLLFLSPVFYAAELVPEPWRPLMRYNPLAAVIEWWRAAILHGQMPAWPPYLAHTLAALLALVLARSLFRRLRPGFADVL